MAKNASRLISFRVSSSSSSSSSSFSSRRLLSTETKTSIKDGTSSLYSRIAALGGTDTNVAETLNEWVKEGKPLLKRDVINFATQLRKYRKYTHAIQLLEWLEKRDGELARGDHAIRLDLLGKSEGVESAENYFAKLPEPCKNKLTYGALLNCYSKAGMTEKAMAHFEKMKELNFASTCLAYNNLMALYIRVGEPEKVLQLLEEMKEKDIKPDVYTYNFLMNSYAATKNIEGVEKAMEEMKKLGVKRDWSTYANLASIYIKADLLDKASKVLKDLEKMNDRRDRKDHHILIGLYAYTSNKLGVYRVWESLKSAYPTVTNLSYLILLQALYKIGDIDGLRKYFEEWESSCLSYDIRLANVLIDYYLSQDMLEEAESLQESAVTRGATPNSRTLEAFMDFYLKKGDGKSALKCLETAASTVQNHKWKPTQETVRMFSKYFEEEKDVDGAENFYMRLKNIKKLNSEVYDSLIRTYIAAGKKEPRMLQRMKEDGIELNPGTQKLLGRVCPPSSE